jgi:hypothetical protein
MNSRVHRVLTAVLGSLTGVSALLAATDPAALGVGPQAWAWIAVVLSVATVVATAARHAWEA